MAFVQITAENPLGCDENIFALGRRRSSLRYFSAPGFVIYDTLALVITFQAI